MDELALADALARVRAERPGLAFDEAALRVRLAALGEARPLADLHVGDLALCAACLAGNSAALAAFEREHIAAIPAMLARSSTDRALIDEVQQRARARLLVGDTTSGPKLASYAGRGALGAWIRVVASRALLDLRAERGPAPADGDAELAQISLGDDPELRFIKERHRAQVKAAFGEAFAALRAEDRTLLRLSLLDGLTIDQIGRVLQIHRTTVIRKLQEVREALVAEVRRRLTLRLLVPRAEVDELILLVGSQLELSLSRVLS